MSTQLGTLEELPQEYRDAMTDIAVVPLWPQMRKVLPHNAPLPVTKPHCWSYQEIRPLLLRAGELTPVEKAERRVLFLVDPGRGPGAMQVSPTIYIGLQLLLPGETAPAHVHTPSAARIVVEGEGGYTVVDGDKLPMKAGDLILTPGGCWHDHGHEGKDPVIWLDALDLPLFYYLEGSYAIEGPLQAPRNRPDPSEVEYRASGLVPSRRRDKPAPSAYPMMRFPWERTEAALRHFALHGEGGLIELDYINPETGQSCLPTLGFTALMLRAGETVKPVRKSSSGVYHVISGKGYTLVDGKRHDWQAKDVISAPVFAKIEHHAEGDDAFMIRIHDGPLQERLGYYEERPI